MMALDTAARATYRLDLVEHRTNLADAPMRLDRDEPAEQLIEPVLHASGFLAYGP